MRRGPSVAGIVPAGVLFWLSIVAFVAAGCGDNTDVSALRADVAALRVDLNRVDSLGRELREWAGKTDVDTTDNFTAGGLTSYLIALKNHLTDHISKLPNAAHTGAHDSHLDPPPPPVW